MTENSTAFPPVKPSSTTATPSSPTVDLVDLVDLDDRHTGRSGDFAHIEAVREQEEPLADTDPASEP